MISAHTAHDHGRAVRTKLGVRNRAGVASRVFADHYFERFLATAIVAHDRGAGDSPRKQGQASFVPVTGCRAGTKRVRM